MTVHCIISAFAVNFFQVAQAQARLVTQLLLVRLGTSHPLEAMVGHPRWGTAP